MIMVKEEPVEKTISKTSAADATTNEKNPQVVEDTPEARNRRIQNEEIDRRNKERKAASGK